MKKILKAKNRIYYLLFSLIFLLTLSCYSQGLNNSNTIPKDWTMYEIQDICKIAIPSTLELRNDNSFISKVVNKYQDNFAAQINIQMLKSNLIFQPKGLNELNKSAVSKYSRILIKHIKGEPGDFNKWDERVELSRSEKIELDDYFKQNVVDQIAYLDIKLIKWFPIEFSIVNGISYMKTSFTRQMKDNPIVKVDVYYIFNFDETIEITLSYRVNESNLWASDFSKIIKTFSLSNKK